MYLVGAAVAWVVLFVNSQDYKVNIWLTYFVLVRAAYQTTFFFLHFPLFFPKETGKTRNIFKLWKLNRGQNIWNA